MPRKALFESLADTLPANAHHMRAWLSLVGCFTSVERVLMRHFAQKFNSSLPRYDVLTALSLHSEGLTMGQLAAKLVVTKGNTTGVVRRLSEDGLVKKITSRDDGRVQLVTISRRGKTVWKEMHEDYDRLVADSLSGLTKTQARELAISLDRARVAVNASANQILQGGNST